MGELLSFSFQSEKELEEKKRENSHLVSLQNNELKSTNIISSIATERALLLDLSVIFSEYKEISKKGQVK